MQHQLSAMAGGQMRGHCTGLQVNKPLGNSWSAFLERWRVRRQRVEAKRVSLMETPYSTTQETA